MTWTDCIEQGTLASQARYADWQCWLRWMEQVGGEQPEAWPRPSQYEGEVPDTTVNETALRALVRWWQREPHICWNDTGRRSGFWATSFRDVGYPAALHRLSRPPVLIWSWRALAASWWVYPAVAMVGARAASCYGRTVARQFAEYAAAQHAVVVSGCAVGIDAAVHAAAIAAGGHTIGWVASGIDRVSPRVHTLLSSPRANILTEYQPGIDAQPWRYIERNRLIAGISQAVLVVEAGAASGTLHTVRHAHDQGKEVFVVPHSITCEYAPAMAALANEKANVVVHPSQLFGEGGSRKLGLRAAVLAKATTGDEYQFLDHLLTWEGSALASQLAASLAWPRRRWWMVVSTLQMREIVVLEAGVLTLSDMIQS